MQGKVNQEESEQEEADSTEQLVICNEEDTDGWAMVTDEERCVRACLSWPAVLSLDNAQYS